MSSPVTMLYIDTLAVSKALQKKGLSEEQATGIVEALQSIDASQLATKADIAALSGEIKDSRIETLRYMIGQTLALAVLFFGIMKFIH